MCGLCRKSSFLVNTRNLSMLTTSFIFGKCRERCSVAGFHNWCHNWVLLSLNSILKRNFVADREVKWRKCFPFWKRTCFRHPKAFLRSIKSTIPTTCTHISPFPFYGHFFSKKPEPKKNSNFVCLILSGDYIEGDNENSYKAYVLDHLFYVVRHLLKLYWQNLTTRNVDYTHTFWSIKQHVLLLNFT